MTSPRRFEAVIFDMDGVLVDSEPMHAETARLVLEPWPAAHRDFDSARYFGFTDVEMFADVVRRHALPVAVDELVRRRVEMIVRHTWESPHPMDGVADVPRALHTAGYRLALASSSGPEGIAATLGALDLRPVFEVVVSGLTLGRGKPAPDIFLETARQLGVAPATCLVVEDSRNGLLAAKAAGMACASIPCAATSGENFAEADYRFKSLSELLSLLA